MDIERNGMEIVLERNGNCGSATAMVLDASSTAMANDNAMAMALDMSSALMADNDVMATTLDTSFGKMVCRR